MLLLALLPLLPLPSLGVPSPGCGAGLQEGDPRPGEHARYEVGVSDPWTGEELTRDYWLHLPASYPDTDHATPLPLVLDYPGWCVNASWQMHNKQWPALADSDPDPFLYVALNGMNDIDHPAPDGWDVYNSWNFSATHGPLGLTCDPALVSKSRPCYTSCAAYAGGDCGYLEGSCDWTSCHDDLAYTERALYDILARFCVDTERVHVTGMSNGGMFIWTRVLARLAGSVAAAGTVCSAPTRGFNIMPDSPLSIIDFHGLLDDVVPYSPEAPNNLGPGPDMTTEARDGHYYTIKRDHLVQVAASMHCQDTPSVYPTPMDGEAGWACEVWGGCDGGNEVVGCTAQYGHSYPWHDDYSTEMEGFKITWDFMKAHSKAVL